MIHPTKKMPDQLTFNLPVETAFGRSDYFVSEANALVVEQVRTWKTWVNGRCILCGPTGAGKSHLASIWAGDIDAEMLSADAIATWQPKAFQRPIALDTFDDTGDETALLFLLNHMHAHGLPVLITMAKPPAYSSIALPDLKSRLEASSIAELNAVDDLLVKAVFLKQVDERQLTIAPDVVDFALRKADRDLASTKKLVAALDRLSLQQKKAVSKRLVTDAIEHLTQGDPHD